MVRDDSNEEAAFESIDGRERGGEQYQWRVRKKKGADPGDLRFGLVGELTHNSQMRGACSSLAHSRTHSSMAALSIWLTVKHAYVGRNWGDVGI